MSSGQVERQLGKSRHYLPRVRVGTPVYKTLVIVKKILCKIIPTLCVRTDACVPTPVHRVEVIVDNWPSDGAQTSMDGIGEQKIYLPAWSEERVKHVVGRETGRTDERSFAHLLIRRGVLNDLLFADSLENPSVLYFECWVLEELFDRC